MSRVRVGVVRRPESVDSSPRASRARAGDGRPGSGGNLPPHSQRVCDRDGSAEESGEVAGESGIHRRHAGSGRLAVAALTRRTEINGIARVGSAGLQDTGLAMTGLLQALLFLSTLGVARNAESQRAPAPPAVPVEPIGAIVEAFRSHAIVALGEGVHGNEQSHAFRLALIRDPRFAAVVNDIVVECGNAKYQEIMDRFVRGDDVPYETLRQVWQNTTQISGVWDYPIYEEFFRAVRNVNASLPRERQLRVLLGDPPVDWDRVLQGKDDVGKWTPERDHHAVGVIRGEVISKGRRALVIYGGGHLFRAGQSLVSQLERDAGIKVFTIATAMSTMFEDLIALQPDATSWPIPSLATVRGTSLDAKQLTYRDAVLYLGPPSAMTFSRLPPSLCSDARYLEMRLERVRLTGAVDEESRMREQLKRECASHAPK